MKSLWTAALLFGLLLAGCAEDSDAPDDVQDGPALLPAQRFTPPEDPMAMEPGHDHSDSSQHKFLWNYDVSSHDPILGNAASMSGVHALDLQADHLFGAIYGSHTVSVDGGVVIWDVSDPARPVQTGRWIVPGSVGGDRSIEATPDGDFVVLVTEPVTCFTQVGANPFTAYLLDTRDKSQPIVADVATIPGPTLGSPTVLNPAATGHHSVSVTNIDGEDYAFLFGKVYRIDRTEQGGRLIDLETSIPIGHDMYLRQTPWGDTWAIAAGGNLKIFNVTDPANPVRIAEWSIPEESWHGAIDYYIHTADVGFFDDQDILVVTTEDWLDWTSYAFILDATSLRAHEGTEPYDLPWIGEWRNPGNHTAEGLSYSMHNPRFGDDGIFTISHYHGGLWQLDFRHPDLRAEPTEVAYALYAENDGPVVMDPVQGADACNLGYGVDAPSYMDVELGPDGILYAADVYTGLYTFTPTVDHPVYGGVA